MQVEQIDREAAASVYTSEGFAYDAALVPSGDCDHWPIVEAFARHRIAERERVVAEICEFLRDYPAEQYKRDIAYTIAYRIEVEFGAYTDSQ